ncbi:phage distal tail protein [Actinoplanes sp. URMC 104]|uniref:phage distal tail protein n=1 Tax=Actinoplanes sp. URMC 104 TaxID=3423409 RepID=UPI003F1D3437
MTAPVDEQTLYPDDDLGTMSATWIDPDGIEWPLSNDELGWFTMSGPAGWGATPIEIVVDPLPRGGEQVRYIRQRPRRLQWPLYIGADEGGGHQNFVDKYRALMRAFTKTTQRGAPGWLVVSRPATGRSRRIACYYEEGFDGAAGENHLWAKPVIGLYCPDGYWSGDTAVVERREFQATGTTPASFYSPFINVTSSRVVTDDGAGSSTTTLLNDGDVEAWPTWSITGPISELTAKNLTTGARFKLAYTLTAGQKITITTNRPTVRLAATGANLSKYIDWLNPAGTELWPLVDGENDITFTALGAGTGTAVELAFTPRYETA